MSEINSQLDYGQTQDKDIQILLNLKQSKQTELQNMEKECHSLALTVMQRDMQKRKHCNEQLTMHVPVLPDTHRTSSHCHPAISVPGIN